MLGSVRFVYRRLEKRSDPECLGSKALVLSLVSNRTAACSANVLPSDVFLYVF